jgi:hypothetical protein
MATLKNRVARLEKEQQFRTWLDFERFLEGLSDEQLEEIAIFWRFPEPLPEPLPMGASRLDGLDRSHLMRLWEESERETARIMHEMRGRSPEECRFHLHHEHWPEQACSAANCRKRRLDMAMKESPPAPASKHS